MQTKIVLGLLFGDEGKGSTTSFLCSLATSPLVIRFNGGHQAGHTVVYKGRQHKFSSFGSGTLQNVPTYWSKYCTFYPTAVLNEYEFLRDLDPMLYVDPLCPITTPFDIMEAQENEKINQHGSCGVGFGQTLKRHEENHFKLFVQDMYHPKIFETKLNNIIEKYYGLDSLSLTKKINHFLKQVEEVRKIIIPFTPYFKQYSDIIFEGAQGIMLDMDFGFFPNVTRSNTTCKNAMELIKEFNLPQPEIYYVTRAYQTRHGNGFLSNEEIKLELINTETETNQLDEWQGSFRKSILDLDMINYALRCDKYFSKKFEKNLVMTCLDQVDGNEISFTFQKGKKMKGDIFSIIDHMAVNFSKIFISKNPEGIHIEEKIRIFDEI